jgi:Flp pilus assembly pilin Flp
MSAVIHHLPTPAPISTDPVAARGGAARSALPATPARDLAQVREPAGQATTDEEGSLVTEYGLLAVVAATIAGAVISWASNGALVTLFNALLRHARGIVGA